jgi:hypothetical protein
MHRHVFLFLSESQIQVGEQNFTLKPDMVAVKRYKKKVHGKYNAFIAFGKE